MAACGSLEHIFEKPLPDSPSSFLESLSPWTHIKSMKTIDESSFTELFGELHFKENHHIHSPSTESPSTSSSSSPTISSSTDAPKREENSNRDSINPPTSSSYNYQILNKQYRHSDSFSSMNSESLSLCTEGLGFESFDDVVEDLLRNDAESKHEDAGENQQARKTRITEHEIHPIHEGTKRSSSRRRRSTGTIFPPPISCIGRSGKPWVCFKSYRQDGRFILKEVRIPTQEFLHACRENGRLRLRFVQSDDEIIDEDDDEEEDDGGEEIITGNNDEEEDGDENVENSS